MSPDDAAVPAMDPGPGSDRVAPDEVDRESWREFLAPGPFGDVDPALYGFETTAAPETAVVAWMTAQPLADRDPTAALVRDRAEERLRVVAPDQMAAYDQLRSESRQAPLEAMRTIARRSDAATQVRPPRRPPGRQRPGRRRRLPAARPRPGPWGPGRRSAARPDRPWSQAPIRHQCHPAGNWNSEAPPVSAACEQPDHVLLIIVVLEHECWQCPVLTASVVGFTRPGRKRLSQMIRADSEALIGWTGQLIPEEDRQLGGIGRIRARPFGPARSYVSNGCCYCDAVQPTHLLEQRVTAGPAVYGDDEPYNMHQVEIPVAWWDQLVRDHPPPDAVDALVGHPAWPHADSCGGEEIRPALTIRRLPPG